MTRRRVREAAPLQVYLVADERERLDRLASQLDSTKSDVIRRALLALERELLSPSAHPALRLIGIADAEVDGFVGALPEGQVTAFIEEASWSRSAAGRGARGKRPMKKRGR